jgi:hypothetical protein
MTGLPKTIYHGSASPLKAGDVLRPGKSLDSDMSQELTAIFATPDVDYAKSFAITSSIGNRGIIWFDGKQFIAQKMTRFPPSPESKFFIFELDSKGFELDKRREYFYMGEKEILAVHEFNLLDEIKNIGIEFYEFDDFDEEADKDMTLEKRKEIFDRGIRDKKYHKVNL